MAFNQRFSTDDNRTALEVSAQADFQPLQELRPGGRLARDYFSDPVILLIALSVTELPQENQLIQPEYFDNAIAGSSCRSA